MSPRSFFDGDFEIRSTIVKGPIRAIELEKLGANVTRAFHHQKADIR
jgi:hypothetical protein